MEKLVISPKTKKDVSYQLIVWGFPKRYSDDGELRWFKTKEHLVRACWG